MARIYVDKDNGRIERTDMYLVKLTLNDGTVIEDLEPRRLFPHTNTLQYVTLLNNKEKEVALIKELKDLDKDSRKALEDCFTEYYMIPKISRVLHVEDKFGALKMTVMTDRGEISFRIRNRHSDIKMLHRNGRVLIRDSDDNRYVIDDYRQLDAHSRAQLIADL